MQTSRAALNRLLDESDPSLTITTLTCAAVALGNRVEMNLAEAKLGFGECQNNVDLTPID